MANVKRNFLYNLILTLANYVFPLLTYPYVSRVLGVQNIGVCNYVDSIINYFVLFAALGVGSLGVREIAKAKEDRQLSCEIFSSLCAFNILMTVAAVACLLGATYLMPSLAPYKPFIWIGVSKLVFSAFLIEWFFQGISDFKYITMRSLIVRCVYTASVFIFVRTENDAAAYYWLISLTTCANAVFNWHYSRRYVTLSLKSIHMRRYLAPIFSYGLYRILTSLYSTFNVVFLGYMCGDVEVGYFSTATKLYIIIMGVFTAFTTVMVPRVSELLGKGDMEQLSDIANKTFAVIYMVSIPLMVFCWFYASHIVTIIAGTGYDGAVVPFKIVMTLLLVIAAEQIIIQQFLMAVTRGTNCIVYLSLTGAVVGVVMNALLTPVLFSTGSAVSWVASEVAVLVLGLAYFKRYFPIHLPAGLLAKHLLLNVPTVAICYLCCDMGFVASLLVGMTITFIWFLIANLFVVKNDLLWQMVHRVMKQKRLQ